MQRDNNAAGERIAGPVPRPDGLAEMVDVKAVASALGCSIRHVYRLVDSGRMPPPVKLGALVRWPRTTLVTWIESGCMPVGTEQGGA